MKQCSIRTSNGSVLWFFISIVFYSYCTTASGMNTNICIHYKDTHTRWTTNLIGPIESHVPRITINLK